MARAPRRRASGVVKGVFATCMFAAAVWIIARELESATLVQIGAALASTPPWAVGASIVAAGLSYVCLAASEWWALAVLGKRLAAWRVVLVTFVSYATSNTLGFSLATGGAVRLRLYPSWGLTRGEAATVTLLAGVAVTLSGAITAGLALLATSALPQWIYLLALPLLAPGWLWLGRLPRSAPFIPRLKITTPPLGWRTTALAGGILDWMFSGFALFILLPNPTPEHFTAFLAIFVLGSIVSAASGVPGGVGVFEAVVLALSRHFALSVETAAALLLYRLIYAVGPFVLAALGLTAHQARLKPRGPAMEDATPASQADQAVQSAPRHEHDRIPDDMDRSLDL